MYPIQAATVLSVLFVILSVCSVWRVEAGCLDHGICCPGKNSSCYSSSKHPTSGEAKNCYCDEKCTASKDCCEDYNKACKAVDCEVSIWREWGGCSKHCGEGARKRTRSVVTQPRNGGKRCAHLFEIQKCFGHECHRKRATRPRAVRETARILPIKFGQYRTSMTYDIRQGIRKNLFYHYHSHNSILSKPSYCATFEITYSRRHCARTILGDWARQLKGGAKLCMECQANAMYSRLDGRCKGDGVAGRETRWNAVNIAGCHGWWKMVTKPKQCDCNPEASMSFIYV